MRTKLRSKVTLLFMTLGLLLAIPAVALADIIQDEINGVTSTVGNETVNLVEDDTKTVTYWVQRVNSGAPPPTGDGDGGCNIDGGGTPEQLYIKVTSSDPAVANALAGQGNVTELTQNGNTGLYVGPFTDCDLTNGKTAQIKALASGSANFSVTVPASGATATNANNQTVNLNTTGSGTYDITTDATYTVNVAKKTNVTVDPASGFTGGSVTLKAKLADKSGQGVANKSLSFTLNNGTPQSATTDSNGNAQVSATAPNSAGNYPINVSFAGDSDRFTTTPKGYAPSSGSNTLTVTADNTAPTSSATAKKADNNDYTEGSWTNQNVTVTLSADDGQGSGVKEIRYTTTGTAPTATTGTVYTAPFTVSSTTTVKFLAVDKSGNVEAFKSFQVNIDKIAPNPNCGSASANWLGTDATIACAPTDSGGSGLANAANDASFNLVTNVPAGTQDANASTNSRTISDVAGNTATAGPISGNKIDKKAPNVQCGSADGLWHALDVDIACTANDTGGSGLANAASDASFNLSTNVAANTENANASTGSRDVLDAVGNKATAGPITGNMVDKKAPTISNLGPTTNPNLAGWYNTDVTNRFKASDGGSGLSSTCLVNFPAANTNIQSKTTTGEGLALKVTSDSCSDAVGNNAAGVDSATFKVDKTQIPSQAASDRYTNQSSITVSYTTNPAANELSGLKTVELFAKGPGDSGFSKVDENTTDANGSFSYTADVDGDYLFYTVAEDNAGNREAVPATVDARVTVTTRDTVLPTISATHTVDGNNGWNKTSPVTLTVTASDASSGLNGAPSCTDGAANLPLTAGSTAGTWTASVSGEGTHSISCSVSDNATNEANASDTVKIDTIDPSILDGGSVDANGDARGPDGQNGWFVSAVLNKFTASDGGSGLVGQTSPYTFTQSSGTNQGSAVKINSGVIYDMAGNSKSLDSAAYQIDLSNPSTPTFSGIQAQTYPVADLPALSGISCSATDLISPPVNCAVTGYGSTFGPHTLVATATDQAGRQSTNTLTYVVGLKAGEILSPVNSTGKANPLATNLDAFKIKSTIPVKFKLFNDTAMTQLMTNPPAGSVARLSFFKYDSSTDTSDAVDVVSAGSANTDNIFRWDSTNYQYVYNLATSGKTAGTYGVQLTLYNSSASNATVLAQSAKYYFVLRS